MISKLNFLETSDKDYWSLFCDKCFYVLKVSTETMSISNKILTVNTILNLLYNFYLIKYEIYYAIKFNYDSWIKFSYLCVFARASIININYCNKFC